MKKLIIQLLTLCLFASLHSNGQKVADDYAFTDGFLEIKLFNPFTKAVIEDPEKSYFTKRGQIFTIEGSATIDGVSGYFITFWTFNKENKQVEAPQAVRGKTPHVIDKTDNGKYFFVSADDVKNKATANFKKPKGWLTVEGVVLPMKLRFKNSQPGGESDFLQSVNIGPAIAKVWNRGGAFGTTSFCLMAGLNLTNISVDETTVPGVVTSKTTLLGLSPFWGISYTYSGISLSILSGFDILTGKAEQAWSYRKSPWLGIGIGTSIFSQSAKNQ